MWSWSKSYWEYIKPLWQNWAHGPWAEASVPWIYFSQDGKHLKQHQQDQKRPSLSFEAQDKYDKIIFQKVATLQGKDIQSTNLTGNGEVFFCNSSSFSHVFPAPLLSPGPLPERSNYSPIIKWYEEIWPWSFQHERTLHATLSSSPRRVCAFMFFWVQVYERLTAVQEQRSHLRSSV